MFIIRCSFEEGPPQEKRLSFITEMSSRAPHLEQFAIFDNQRRFWKRIRAEWVLCVEEENSPRASPAQWWL